MRNRTRQVRRVGCERPIIATLCMCLSLTPASSRGESERAIVEALVGKGRVNHHGWEVLVDDESPGESSGSCFEAAVMTG
jgi:hypothetical protein